MARSHSTPWRQPSTKAFEGTSDGTDSYTLSVTPYGTVPVCVDGLLETDYSISGSRLTLGTAPPKASAIVAWDIVVGGIVPIRLGVYFPGQPEGGATLLQFVAPRAFTLPASLTGSQG